MFPLSVSILSGILQLTGKENRLAFAEGGGGRAVLHASCEADTPYVYGMIPLLVDWTDGAPSEELTVEFHNVPTTCLDVPIDQPCARHSVLTPPLFWCVFEPADAGGGRVVTGPVAAYRHIVKDSEGATLGYAVRANCTWPAWNALRSVYDGSGTLSLKMIMSFFAPAGALAKTIPFGGVNGGNTIQISGLPTPPMMPPPFLPPPPPPPPSPKYKVVAFKLWGAAGGSDGTNDLGGGGGFTIATYHVTKSLTVTAVAGTGGDNGARSDGGGSGGSPQGAQGMQGGSGGGGLVGVFIDSSKSQNTALVIAGSGGGSTLHNPNSNAGAGGGESGGTGSVANGSGKGGTQSENGGSGCSGMAGCTCNGGGGGGAGYFGGGGGCDRGSAHGDGGGGSGFIQKGDSALPEGWTFVSGSTTRADGPKAAGTSDPHWVSPAGCVSGGPSSPKRGRGNGGLVIVLVDDTPVYSIRDKGSDGISIEITA